MARFAWTATGARACSEHGAPCHPRRAAGACRAWRTRPPNPTCQAQRVRGQAEFAAGREPTRMGARGNADHAAPRHAPGRKAAAARARRLCRPCFERVVLGTRLHAEQVAVHGGDEQVQPAWRARGSNQCVRRPRQHVVDHGSATYSTSATQRGLRHATARALTCHSDPDRLPAPWRSCSPPRPGCPRSLQTERTWHMIVGTGYLYLHATPLSCCAPLRQSACCHPPDTPSTAYSRPSPADTTSCSPGRLSSSLTGSTGASTLPPSWACAGGRRGRCVCGQASAGGGGGGGVCK